MIIPNFIDNQSLVRAKFENIIEDKLRSAGFMIITSKESNEIWQRCIEKSGGIIDPVTGKRDEAKSRIVLESALRELSIKYHPDALLYSGVQVVMAKFNGITAYWHGTTEIRSASVLGGFLSEFGRGYWGTIRALSLGISIKNINGIELYNNWGGIQLLQTFVAGKFTDIQYNDLLVKEELYDKSVVIALGPIVDPKWMADNDTPSSIQ